jgi:AbrB family looped-hinge helix DNA binding protein
LVELRIKVGPKGQILIPKVFRDRYGLKEGDAVVIEPEEDGVLIRGRPSTRETEQEIERHLSELEARKIAGPRLGELKKVYLEMEFEEAHDETIPRR